MLFPEAEVTKSLSSNLLKRQYTQVVQKESIVIDTNERVAQRIEDFMAAMSRQAEDGSESGFIEGLDADRVESLPSEEVDALFAEEEELKTPAFAGPTPEELLAEAQAEIEKMKQEAYAVIEAERISARKEAERKGYSDGYAKGMEDVEKFQDRIKKEKQQWEAEFKEQVDNLEPQFIDVLTGIYEHIFNVDLGNYREIIVYLITNTMRKIDSGRSFLIHVSDDDYPYVNMQKKQIASILSAGTSIEIIEDLTLEKNDCLIETDGGIFDCGLGTQLEELNRQLKLLSYEKADKTAASGS